jgi:hypothetical protein
VEWPIPPQRTSVLVRPGRAWRVRNTLSAPWRTAETQITMQSIAGQAGDEISGSWSWARNRATRLMSEVVCTCVILAVQANFRG